MLKNSNDRTDSETLRQKAEELLKKKSEDKILELIEELAFQNGEKAKRADELLIANKELAFQNEEKAKRADELIIANKELAFQVEEKTKRADELIIANKELAFQNEEKIKRAAELIIANKEIAIQTALNLANAEKAELAELHKQALDRLQKIASMVPGVVYQYRLRPDGTSCFPYASEAFNQIYRVTPDEVRYDASRVFANIHPDDSAGVIASIQASAKDLSPRQQEYRVKFDDGTIRFLYNNSLPQQEEDGSILWHGFLTDITGRKQIEEDLKLASVRLELAARAGGVGVWDYDIINNILVWDDQMFALYGISKKNFIGVYEAWLNGVHPDDKVHIEKEIQLAIRGEKELDTEFRITWPDGSIHYIRAIAVVQRNAASQAMRMIGTNWDITAHRHAEKEKLDDSENRYHSIFQGSPDGIMIADEETKMIIFANPAQCQMLGYTEEELKMMTISAIHPAETYQDTLAEFEKHVGGEKNLPRNIQCLKKNGEIFYADISSGFLDMNGRQYIVGFFRDITERREAEVELKEALVKAESGNRLKTAFIQNISHEVRTPLNGILGFGNLLIEPNLTDAEKQQFASLLQASSDRLVNTITDYMDIALIFSDNMNVSRKSVNVMKALTGLKNRFQALCDIKKLAFNLIIPPENESFCIQTDPELFLKIISHLLDNAIKFTREGSITMGFSVGSASIDFFCKDTGAGIEQEAQSRVFESFVQENVASTRGHEGSGLGLSIIKGLTNLLGGEIRLESIKGQGTSFFVSLPFEPEVLYKDEIAKIKNTYSASSGFEILIAEDDLLNMMYIETILKQRASAIYKAVNGQEAVELCRIHPGISMVLMDIKMPVMNGFEATREIRKFNNNMIIIGQTAYAQAGIREEAIEAGCNDYITKPLGKAQILTLMDTYFKMS